MFLIVTNLVNGESKQDSALVEKGHFFFRGKIAIPAKGIMYSTPDYNRIDFYIEPGKIEITSRDSLNNVVITAGQANKDFDKLRAMEKPLLSNL